VQVEADMGDGIEELRVGLPCLLTVTRAVNQPRLPSFRVKKAAQNREITVWSSQDLPGANMKYFGLSGSPTQVERIFAPPETGEQETWQGDPQELSEKFLEKLKELKYL
jgi:electron transfer flavoprotein beta subunit